MADQGQSADLLWSSDIRLNLLGPVRLGNLAGDDFTPKARKTRALLAILALSNGPVQRSRLIDLLWGDRGDEQAKGSLRQALYELRGLSARGYLSANREAARIGPKKLTTDLSALHTRIEEGDAGGVAESLDDMRLPVLAGLDDLTPELDDWLRDERERIAAAVIAGSLDIANRSAATSPSVVRRIADQLERLDPLDERVAQLGIRADLAAGDRPAAARRRARSATRLKEHLGVEPSAATQALLHGSDDAVSPALPPDETVAAAAAKPSPRAGRLIALAAAILILVSAGLAYVLMRPAPAVATPTLAVLPFDDLGQRNQDYFASGVSDEILNLLAHQQRMKVLGRVSAEALAGGRNSLAAARDLGVTYLLDGSVRTSDNRILVIARLTRVADGAQVWSERYERRVGDVFAVQGDIANAVASRIALSFASAEPRGTTPAVYDRYLAARQLSRDRREVTLKRAAQLLREAITLDPQYAPAFAELAQVVMLEADHPTAYGTLPIAQAQAESARLARRAVALDPNLGDAYAALGFVSLNLDGRSEPYMRKAVELSPQRPEFHRWHAQTLMALGRYDEAIAEFKRSVDIDPLWGLTYDHLAGALYHLGRQKEAQNYVRRFLSLSADPRAKLLLLQSLAKMDSRVADELRISRKLEQAYPDERQTRLNLASALAQLGEVRPAAKLMSDNVLARSVLDGDWIAVAGAASSMGAHYWDQWGFWNSTSLLVASGHSDLVAKLYDEAKPAIASGRLSREQVMLPETVVALRNVGRSAEAEKVLEDLRQQNAAKPNVGQLGDERQVTAFIIASLSGDREAAIRGLDEWSRREPFRFIPIPAAALRYDPSFAWLANDPRFSAIEDRLRVACNGERAKAGLPPINHAAWVSDPKALLTKL
jgi:TolB-like protein/DNA-binding SARP family transcriptional activator